MLAGGRLHDDEGTGSRILANQGAARFPPPSYRACPLLDDGLSNGPPKSGRPKLPGKARTQTPGLREAPARAGQYHSGSKVGAAQLHQRTRASRPERRRKLQPLLIDRTYIPGICSAREVAWVVAAWASGIFANPPM